MNGDVPNSVEMTPHIDIRQTSELYLYVVS